MKLIPLTLGQFAKVDDCDYDELMKYKWHAGFMEDMQSYRAVRNGVALQKERTIVKMHRHILGLQKFDNIQVDHIDHDTLNNCRNNLRIVTNLQNQMNRRGNKRATSKYKGVSWHKQTKKWRATIMKHRQQTHLGVFNSEQEAALAYNRAAIIMFGEYAYLNNIK